MQQIDRERLYTDLKYRFEYLCKFIEFGNEDISLIKDQKVVAKLTEVLDGLIDAVYIKLFSFDITAKVFLGRHEGMSKDVDVATELDHLTLNSPQIIHRKNFLKNYFVKLVTSEYEKEDKLQEFIKYLDWVGRIHTDTPLKTSKINVEYIHINALLAWVESQVILAIYSIGLEKDKESKTLVAFNKLFWIQNDLFAKYYVKEAIEIQAKADIAAKINA